MFEDMKEALAADSRQHRRRCGFGAWLRTLDETDSRRAEELVFDSDYTARELARYFNTKGAQVNDQVLNRHRKGRCCGQDPVA